MLPTLALVLMLPAAPVPKEADRERIAKLFGEVVSERKPELAMDKDTLVMGLPKREGDKSAFEKPIRLARAVRGSFRAEVAIRYACRRNRRRSSSWVAG